MAVAAHDGIARATVPAHTPLDGDLVFAAATARGAEADDALMMEICAAAAHCLARAIARGVWHARAAPGDVLPSWQDLNRP